MSRWLLVSTIAIFGGPAGLTSSSKPPMLEQMSYPGGKNGAGVYQTIINLMPPHETYIEPFLGGGAVMRLKRPAALNIGVDIDPDVIRGWESSTAGDGDTAGGIARTGAARRRDSAELAVAAEIAGNGDGRRRSSASPKVASGDGDPASFPFEFISTGAHSGRFRS